MRAVALALLLVLAGCGPPPPSGPPHIVIWLVDTLRADHLHCYGYERPTSPVIDRLAGEGVLFGEAHAHTNWTQPSVTTILSGCYPPTFDEHFGTPVPQGLTLAAQWLKTCGYARAGFTVTAATSAVFGFHRGFRVYDELDLLESAKDRKHREGPAFDAARVVDAAVDWLDRPRLPGEPFFLFLHTVDPHAPYDSHPGLPSFTGPYDGPFDGSTTQIAEALRNGVAFSAADRQHITDLYDDEIQYNDAQLGHLVEALEQRHLLANTLLVIVADHGEELWERGTLGHGHRSLQGELTHVPLILHWPAGLPSGVRVDGLMRLVDLLPTLLDLAGLPPLPDADGVSVADVLNGGQPLAARGHVLFADRAKTPDDLIALRTENVLLEDDPVKDTVELYDLRSDPGATVNLRSRRPDDVRRLRRQLQEWKALRDERQQLWRSNRTPLALDEQTRRSLQALGYLGDG